MPDHPEAMAYRLSILEKACDANERVLTRHSETLAVHEEQIHGSGGLVNAMERLSKKVDSLNRALYAFAGSFIAAAVTIALAVGGH